jgi:hypothetical protein
VSVRFDATGDQYTAATGLPGTTMTALWWGKIVTDRNTYSTFVSIDAGDTQVLAVQTDTDGVSPYLWVDPEADGFLDISFPAMTVGNWYRMAVVRSTTAITLYLAASSGSVTSGGTTLTGALTPTALRVGQSPTSGEWINGSVANLKIYNAALTQAEIEAEWSNWSAVRSADLLRHHKWQSAAETTDYSGNGHSLTSGGTPTFDSGNPSLGANAITGTIDSSLGGLSATLSGTIATSVTGTIDAPLGGLTAGIAGTREVPGTITADLGALTVDVAGSVAPPSILASLGAITATVVGVRSAVGSIAVDLGGLTAHLLRTGPIYPAETLYPSEDLYPGDEPLGVEILVDTLSRYARVAVEIAFGADVTADPDTWEDNWTDVTDDVRVSGGGQISITHGRGDEASKAQPAKMTCTLDNRTGRYSLGTASQHYPYVRRNVPVRVQANLGENVDGGLFPGGYPGGYPTVGLTDPLAGEFRLLWQGFADGFTPRWDVTGRDATVQLSASGVLRRLGQGASPLPSPARRSIPRQSKVVAYWPCEDGPESTVVASGLEGGTPMTITGPAPTWAKNDKATFSEPVLQIHDATLTGMIPAYEDTAGLQVRAYVYLEDEGTWPDDAATLITVHTTGSIARYEIRVGLTANTGQIVLNGYTAGTTTSAFTSGSWGYILDRPNVLGLNFRQETSTTIRWEISRFTPGERLFYYVAGTTAGTLGRATRVVVNDAPGGNLNLTGIGHIAVRAIYEPGRFGRVYGVQAAELAVDRLRRLCEENGVPLTVVGSSDTRMGPQQPGTLLDLLRECETADQGVLVDGLGPGLTYFCRSERSATIPALTADVPSGQLARELAPVDDDQRTRNRWEVTRTKGAKAAVEDVDGLLGSAAIGLYDSSLTVNTHSDTRVRDYAGWLVHLGTTPGYRWPRVSLDLAHSPELAAQWVTVRPSSWLRMTGVNSVRDQLADPIIDLLAEGYTQNIDQFRWNVDVNTSPRDPWAPAVWAADLGDTSDGVLRCDSDGAKLVTVVDPEDTSMVVTTPSGPLWTTLSDDYPLDLDVGGHQVTATACTAPDGRAQTFTILAPGSTLPARAPVQLWQPRVPAL